VRWRREQPEQPAGDDQVLPCARCAAPLKFLGDKDFHEGTRAWGFVHGDFGALLTGGARLEMWGFLPDVG
jgi:hypothetical protein